MKCIVLGSLLPLMVGVLAWLFRVTVANGFFFVTDGTGRYFIADTPEAAVARFNVGV